MFTQAPELQKADEEKMGSHISNNVGAPITFSADSSFKASSFITIGFRQNASKAVTQIDTRAVNDFLRLVAEGEQDQTEAMLRKTPELVLISSNVTDLSERTFKGITGFQYAVWALDWHMWTMIRKYLPDEDAREQIQNMKTGSWVGEHGAYVSWQTLIDALKKTIDLCLEHKWNEANMQWQKQVGGAQCLLPAHVINEYCHPTRSFDPCPNFGEAPLPRTRKTEMGDWFTVDQGKLGETFGFFRETWEQASWMSDLSEALIGGGEVRKAFADHLACHTLLVTRTQQRDALIAELEPPLGPKASSACPFNI